MDKNSQVKDALKKALGIMVNYPIRGEVTAVSGQTCTVQLVTGLEVDEVKMKAVVSQGSDYFMLIPAIGSSVLMLSDDGSLDTLTIIQVDQVQRFELMQSGLKIVFDSSDKKVAISNNSVSLKSLMDDLVDILKTLKLFTNMGPSGTALPDSMVKIERLQQNINSLLK
ncbi:hypothetical protein [Sphingobacterium siyangense]|uniref:Uncharacterized protein n=1 Tax=Sphingobacterium siyangense TaxID=459529 RepID=A0A562MQJ9_9SPHI|nr:hypothetical protein [Sphingobacterium siyangense]TWI22203.1 hypothetical protein IQ31_01608 [Sphingobacterium siyangense]